MMTQSIQKQLFYVTSVRNCKTDSGRILAQCSFPVSATAGAMWAHGLHKTTPVEIPVYQMAGTMSIPWNLGVIEAGIEGVLER